MVCIEINNSKNSHDRDTITNYSDMDYENQDDLNIVRVAGGSIIDYSPVFSLDGEALFVIWKNVVRVFSVTTGEWLRDLEGIESQIISLQLDGHNSKIIIACTESGDFITWKWKSGVKNSKIKLQISHENPSIKSFNHIDGNDGEMEGIVCYSTPESSVINIELFNLNNGESINSIKCPSLNLSSRKIKVSVSSIYKFMVIAKGNKIFVINLLSQNVKCHKNKSNITFVICHPNEELFLTGDGKGKIFQWRQIFSNEPILSLYHWHATPVKTITFTETGSYFYSGGTEHVLVKWTLDRPESKEFLPRMKGCPVHITVGPKNHKVAVSLSDNEIQILNANLVPSIVIQNFTWVADDLTGLNPHPIGLKINPRTSSLVLNGRIGHLQFYSTHSRSLLYNMDIVNENTLATEKDKILYNTRVTHVTLSMDWLITAECWDDQEHFVQTRLKFWSFDKEKQNYSLNTNIYLPHEKGIACLELSSQYSVENLICVSAGQDNVIKIWAHDKNIYSKGKVWLCIGKTSYKIFDVKSVGFSQDGSLLAAGFGNVCCIYTSDSLQLKCILTAPSCLDGNINKVNVKLPENSISSNKKSNKAIFNKEQEKRKKATELIKNFLENDDAQLIKNITSKRTSITNGTAEKNFHIASCFTSLQNEQIYQKIMSLNDLNLYQKLEIFEALNIHCKIGTNARTKLKDYINRMTGSANREIEEIIKNYVTQLNESNKYTSMKRWWYLKKQQKLFQRKRNLKKDIKLLNVFNFDEKKVHIGRNCNGNSMSTTPEKIEDKNIPGSKAAQIKSLSQIKHITFGTGEYAHLLMVCTENRLLVWNLLTLRLQTVLKLSVHKIVVDTFTSLVAVFTIFNDLYVFLPNIPMPLYHRRGLPEIYGAAWIPRRYPKPHSINLDWQATSQLYFLSTNQELLQLVSDKDIDSLATTPAFLSENSHPLSFTPFGAMIAKQMREAANNKNPDYNRSGEFLSSGTPGKSNVHELINLPPHAMAPTNLLCKSFLKSLLITERHKADVLQKENEKIQNTNNDLDGRTDLTNDDSDVEIYEEPSEQQRKANVRQMKISKLEKEIKRGNVVDKAILEEKLKRLAEFQLNFNF